MEDLVGKVLLGLIVAPTAILAVWYTSVLLGEIVTSLREMLRR